MTLVWVVKMTTMWGYGSHKLPDVALPAGMGKCLRPEGSAGLTGAALVLSAI